MKKFDSCACGGTCGCNPNGRDQEMKKNLHLTRAPRQEHTMNKKTMKQAKPKK
jgi:hypothetical protein